MLGKFCAWIQANMYVGLRNSFGHRQRGATMIEYVLIVAIISIAAIAAIVAIGPKINTAFTSVNTALPS